MIEMHLGVLERNLNYIFGRLLGRYEARVSDVGKIINAMIDEGIITSRDDIENDHIAFRTFGVANLGISSLERIFLHYGYERRERYEFPAKKLTAFWYSPPLPEYPRIFMSELPVDRLSPEAQRIIRSYTNEVTCDHVAEIDLDDPVAVDTFLHRPLWRLPTSTEYQRLIEESEYAAWVIYNRYYLNHFTISIHNLPAGLDTLEAFNAFLVRRGLMLNDSGGTIKRSKDDLLLQSSTIAELVEATFADGVRRLISGSYVEFAERRVRPQFQHLRSEELGRAHRRDGFETSNADSIFESTYSSQTQQRVDGSGSEEAQ